MTCAKIVLSIRQGFLICQLVFVDKVVRSKKMVQHLRTYEDFMKIPAIFYKTIGEDIFDYRSSNRRLSLMFKCLLYAGFINFNLLVLGEIIFFYQAVQSKDTVLGAIAVAPCIGFSLVADFKQLALVLNKKIVQKHFDQMESIFPNTIKQQERNRLHYHERIMHRVMIIFSILCLAYTSTFSLYPACKSFVQYYFLGAEKFERRFGFLIWYPYDSTGKTWVYWLTYMGQVHGAYLAGVAFLSADLLLVTSVTQLNMHFDYLSNELTQYEPDVKHEKADLEFLSRIIKHHINCLELSEHVDNIFSFSLLLNFLMASLTICFIGFQVTTSSLEVIIMYCIFLLASMLQVFIVCFLVYGDELMTASLKVGDAAYNQNWFNASIKYKKMLLLIIRRSQRPSCITPPTFSAVSFESYMKVISMSYRFFALLRTTYYDD
ncbi:Odorant receptor 67c [Lucilia cuprina]|nr:Odorant receptor 67c [Lucilia cuprina]